MKDRQPQNDPAAEAGATLEQMPPGATLPAPGVARMAGEGTMMAGSATPGAESSYSSPPEQGSAGRPSQPGAEDRRWIRHLAIAIVAAALLLVGDRASGRHFQSGVSQFAERLAAWYEDRRAPAILCSPRTPVPYTKLAGVVFDVPTCWLSEVQGLLDREVHRFYDPDARAGIVSISVDPIEGPEDLAGLQSEFAALCARPGAVVSDLTGKAEGLDQAEGPRRDIADSLAERIGEALPESAGSEGKGAGTTGAGNEGTRAGSEGTSAGSEGTRAATTGAGTTPEAAPDSAGGDRAAAPTAPAAPAVAQSGSGVSAKPSDGKTPAGKTPPAGAPAAPSQAHPAGPPALFRCVETTSLLGRGQAAPSGGEKKGFATRPSETGPRAALSWLLLSDRIAVRIVYTVREDWASDSMVESEVNRVRSVLASVKPAL